MNKKRIIYISIIIVFVVVIIISLKITSSGGEATEVASEYEASYYVEANDNVFVKISNICEDCCYYLVNMVLGGVEALFSGLTGN